MTNYQLHDVFIFLLFSEYCARCLSSSYTNPSEIHESFSVNSSHLHLTKSSPTSVENTISVDTRQMLQRQLETHRLEKVEWQKKEIVYIAVISCLVFGLLVVFAAFLVRLKFPHHKATGGLTRWRQIACLRLTSATLSILSLPLHFNPVTFDTVRQRSSA